MPGRGVTILALWRRRCRGFYSNMKMNCLSLWTAVLGAAAMNLVEGAPVPLPASSQLPLGFFSDRGFQIRVRQAPPTPFLANNQLRAIQQLNDTLLDADHNSVTNIAPAGPLARGAYAADVVSFERDGNDVTVQVPDPNDPTVKNPVTFSAIGFPGVPTDTSDQPNFAVEVVAFLELPAGVTTFGVSVAADRTDVNDDDGYVVYSSTNPSDFFGTKLGEFDRNAEGFTANQRNENIWSVSAATKSVYPFRLVYWQTGRGANLQFYTIADDGTRTLVNDTGGIKAYRTTSLAVANRPYVAEATPPAGSEGVPANAPVTALIVDGAKTVATAGVKLYLNDVRVTPQLLEKTGDRIALRYDPNASRSEVNNNVRLEFADSDGLVRTNVWSFGILTSGASTTKVTGQWDFDSGNLNATVGAPLTYLDGANGLTATGTQFGLCSQLGVPLIGGVDAKVMRVPGDLKREIGYVMTHGIAPNGGGTKVNQFTIVYDLYVDVTGPGAASLLQISSLNNTDDGDLFWQGNNFGQGTGGYNGRGTFTAGAWHRVVAAYDLAANPPVVTKYVDGIKQDDWTAGQGLDLPRRALQPTAVLFGDGDQDERRTMWVNSIQIRSGKLTDAECFVLGGATADGIPLVIPQSTVTGQWDFNFKDLGASIGAPLQYLDGADGLTKAGTEYGKCSELGVALINGEDADVMKVPGDLKREIGYVMTHGIAPNGGGTKVNQYTLVFDVFVDTTGPGAASLLQLSSLANTDDGDLFWQGSNFGQGTGGYNGRGTFTAGAWHRVVAAYDEAATTPVVVKYVDGVKQDEWTAGQGVDLPRRAMQPTAILFGDGDQDERRTMWVNSIQVRKGRLSDAEIVELGGPSAAGIPVSVPKSTVTGQWDFNFADLGATIGANLDYLDGPTGLTKAGTVFGKCSELGVPLINGKDADVMKSPGDLKRELGYVMTHRIAPNGGGTKVNQYTLVFDILVGTTGPGAASLLQLSSLANTDDGDLFWQGSNFGQGTDGYKGTGAFTAGEWHRVVAAYDEAATPPVVTKFVDGVKQDDWTANQGLDNPRRAMQPTAILFGDGDQDERRDMYVNSIQVRAGKLSDAEMIALGAPTGDALPASIAVAQPTVRPTLAVTRNANGSLVLTWDAAAGFVLESKASLGDAQWTTVPGGSPVTVAPGQPAAYYRLRF